MLEIYFVAILEYSNRDITFVKNKLHLQHSLLIPFFYFHISIEFICESGLRGKCRTRYRQVGLKHNTKFRLTAALTVETESERKLFKSTHPQIKFLLLNCDRAITQAFSRLLPTAEARVRARVR
jgi:hypothetical protein